MAEENQEDVTQANAAENASEGGGGAPVGVETSATGSPSAVVAGAAAAKRGNRAQKVGIVASDKMQKTIVVRVDRLVKHPKYRRYVRRTSKFMAHDETGAAIGDKVRIVETRPLSARKRWRVVEIVQKALK